jgi:hypothetical protein
VVHPILTKPVSSLAKKTADFAALPSFWRAMRPLKPQNHSSMAHPKSIAQNFCQKLEKNSKTPDPRIDSLHPEDAISQMHHATKNFVKPLTSMFAEAQAKTPEHPLLGGTISKPTNQGAWQDSEAPTHHTLVPLCVKTKTNGQV